MLKAPNTLQLLSRSASKCPYTHLSVSDQNITPFYLSVDDVPTIRAMATVNVMGNKIGKEQLSKLQEMMQAHPALVSLCGIADDATEANLSGLGMDVDDAFFVADELSAKGAFEKLLMGANGFKGAYVGKALGDAIAANTVLKELDISGGTYWPEQCDLAFVKEFSVGLGANGALVKFDISNNWLCVAGCEALAAALSGNQTMTELNVSSNSMGWIDGKHKGTSGVIAMANAIKTMGALTSLNVSNNSLGNRVSDMTGIKALVAAIPESK